MTATFRESGRYFDIPRIAPVAVGVERPLWSVMIPTFNCAQYLRHTLKSVLAQDPGPKHMQIEVVDDASTKDDPEAVVKEIAGDRVLFYRKEKNGGAIANFNTCVERSVGRLVHLLHGDDTVEPGFYAAFAAAFENSPGCAAVYSRVFVIDEENDLLGLSDYMPSLKRESTDARELMLTNPIRTPGVVIRRQFYEENGGFQPALVHTADWEMWARSVLHGGARMLNRPLASYRSFGANDSSRLMQTAENVRDHLRLGAIWEARAACRALIAPPLTGWFIAWHSRNNGEGSPTPATRTLPRRTTRSCASTVRPVAEFGCGSGRSWLRSNDL